MGFSLVGYKEGNTSRNGDGTTLQRRAILSADNTNETTISALAYLSTTLGIQRGSAHPSYPLAQVVNISPSRDENSHSVFYMDLEYATNALRRTNNPAAEEENPLLEPSKRAFSITQSSYTSLISPITGAPLVNSAGSPLTGIEFPRWEFVITISRNELANSVGHYFFYNNSIDTSGFLGAYPGETYLLINHGEEQYKAGNWYMTVDYEIHAMPRVYVEKVFALADDQCPLYNANGSIKSYDYSTNQLTASATSAYVSAFDRLELMQGFNYWSFDGMAWKLLRFQDGNGQDSAEPELLNEVGTRLLAPNERLESQGAAVYRAFMGKHRADWSALNLLAT